MVTDQQVRRLRKLMHTKKTKATAADKAGMDEKTARKYMGLDRLPSEMKKENTWRTREDPFEEAWEDLSKQLTENQSGVGSEDAV